MNRISSVKCSQVIAALVVGNSIRATVRMTGVSKNAMQRLMAVLGPACEAYENRVLHNLPCKKIQCDEIWSFSYAKDKNVPVAMEAGIVDHIWTLEEVVGLLSESVQKAA